MRVKTNIYNSYRSKKGENEVLENIAWNVFLSTGDLNSYLCYKDLEEKTNEEEEKEEHLTN